MATHPSGYPFLPEESHGQRSLVNYSSWGRTESDRTEGTSHARQSCCWGSDECSEPPALTPSNGQRHFWEFSGSLSGINCKPLSLGLTQRPCYVPPWSEVKVVQLCLTLCDPKDCIVHGVALQARPRRIQVKPSSPELQADSLSAEPQGKPKKTGLGSLSSWPRNQTGSVALQADSLPAELSGKPLCSMTFSQCLCQHHPL